MKSFKENYSHRLIYIRALSLYKTNRLLVSSLSDKGILIKRHEMRFPVEKKNVF